MCQEERTDFREIMRSLLNMGLGRNSKDEESKSSLDDWRLKD